MSTISIFQKENQITGQKPLLTILKHIKTGRYKDIVLDIREKKTLGLSDLDDYLQKCIYLLF